MANIKWSEEQDAAIHSIHTNELLNAGAGSGKTAVLSEHVIYLLQNGYKLNQLLVMTFTNPAANEMKQRIKKKIEAIPELNEKYGDEIDACHIQTFDAFALFLVKKYHYVLNVNKDINVFDGNIEVVLIKKTIDQVMNEYYEGSNPAFFKMIKNFCLKNDDDIYSLVGTMMHTADLQLDKEKFYSEFIPKFYNDEFVQSMIDKRFANMRSYLKIIKDAAAKLQTVEDAENITKFVDKLLECKDYDSLFYQVSTNKLPKKVTDKEATDKDYRDAIKAFYDNNFAKDTVNFGDSKTIKEVYLSNVEYAEIIIELAREVESRLNAYKKAHNVYSFGDIAKMALQLLENDEILAEVKSDFKYLLIDEYQDTNDIQEALILKLEDNNVFMVGDVKQSIYRFRNANCLIFQNKYNKYKHDKDGGGHVIDMTQNFRSRQELVEDFNLLFSQFMTKKTNLIDYLDGHMTKFGFKKYLSASDERFNYGISIQKYDHDEEMDDSEHEARIIAEDIIYKINNHYQVFKDENETRDITFKDFAIIMDRGKFFDLYKRVFNEYQIPLFVLNDEKLATNVIALLVPNLLKAFKAVQNDDYQSGFDHCYASIARSFLCSFDDETIYHTIKDKTYASDPMVLMLKEVAKVHKNSPLNVILTAIFDKFDIYTKIQTIGDYNSISNTITMFTTLMGNMDKLVYSLDDAIEYFNDAKSFEVEMEASPIKESDNSVILLNIHKSKGLEFPICYYPGLNNPFNRMDINAGKAISKNYGLVMPVIGEHSDVINLARNLNQKEMIQDDFEEKLRLFYVALTRAKEAAIIIDVNDEKEAPLDITAADSFHKFLKFVKYRNNAYFQHPGLSYPKLEIVEEVKQSEPFVLHDTLDINYTQIETKRASKTLSEDAEVSALEFGNKMHLLLELADLNTKDLSYIKDEKERKYVQNVLNLGIFEGVDNEHIRHEFAYYDDNNHLLGIIDCMLIKEDEIDIIDFKLKNIDDVAYQKQLQVYYDYVKTITNKKIKTYLISIIDGKISEVKVNG